MHVYLNRYHEEKPRRYRRILWLFVNATIFRILPWVPRRALIRLFGNKQGFDVTFYPTVKVFAPWNLEIGQHVCIGPHVEFYNKDWVIIGDQVTISRDVFFCTASHDIASPTMALVTSPIVIRNQVWIGAKATILPGVTIGEGAVVGAGAVVAKDVPPWSVVVGNPARVVGERRIRDGV